MEFECPICLEKIKYATVGSCLHHFCYFCLFKHCKFSNKCPICKTDILELRLDREFDLLINQDTLPKLQYSNEIIMVPKLGEEPGLTIRNNLNGPGVKISKIKSNGLFKKHDFKINDIILFINEIPCSNHTFVIKQIMNLFQSNKILKIIKL